MHYDLIITSRLFVACILGGIIGWQRERLDRPAGFRTHILVSLGTALFTLIGMYGFGTDFAKGISFDPSRIAAQVVTGIGFLGGGTIMRHNFEVKGLTTAASIWCTSAIGMSIASGLYWAGIFITVLSFVVLEGSFERYIFRNKHVLKITVDNGNKEVSDIGSLLNEYKISIKDVSVLPMNDSNKMTLEFLIRVPLGVELSDIINKINNIDGVNFIQQTY